MAEIESVSVLDKGFVGLVDYMGDDLSVVQAARISNGAELPDWRGAADEKLINFLAKNGHMTPFEHAVFKFYVKAPLFVVREWQRHRTFSYNERSGRYKEFEPEFYMPDHARAPDPDNKQSSVDLERGDPKSLTMVLDIGEIIDYSFRAYQRMLSYGIAREVARIVLPLNLYSEFIVTGNFRNWMHFLSLRNTPEAQYEIRVYAEAIAGILEHMMPISYAALTASPD